MGSTISWNSGTTSNETSNNQGANPGGNSFLDVISAFFANLNIKIDDSGTKITDKLGNATIEYFKPSQSFARDQRFQLTNLQETTKLRVQLWILYAIVGAGVLFLVLRKR